MTSMSYAFSAACPAQECKIDPGCNSWRHLIKGAKLLHSFICFTFFIMLVVCCMVVWIFCVVLGYNYVSNGDWILRRLGVCIDQEIGWEYCMKNIPLGRTYGFET